MVIWSVVLVDFFPLGDGMVAAFLETDFLADALPAGFYGVLPADLEGVNFITFSTDDTAAAATAPFLAAAAFLAALLDPAFFLPLTTLGASWVSFLRDPFPFSWTRMSARATV